MLLKIVILSKTYKLMRYSLIIHVKRLKMTFMCLNATVNS